MHGFKHLSRSTAKVLRFGTACLALAFLSSSSSCLSSAQETPVPEALVPRQTKELATIRDAIQQATNIAAASDEPWTIPLWAEIAEARARAGDSQGAFEVLKRFSNDSQYVRGVMNAMAPYLVNHGVAQQALRVLAANPHGEDKFIGFRAIIFVQAHTGEIAGASESLAEMSREAKNVNVSEQTGVSAVSAANIQREVELAMRTVAVGLAESGNYGRAMDIALEIKDNSLRAGALLPIGAAQSRAGDRQSAGNVFKQADETIRGIQDKSAQSLAIVQLARAQAQGKDTEAAFSTAERLNESHRSINPIYASVLRGISLEQARFGDPSGASHTAGRIEIMGEKLAALEDIASIQLKRGDRSGALTTCQAELQLIPAKSDSAEIVSRIPTIALIQANSGDSGAAAKSLERALAMAPAVRDAGGQFSIIADVAVAQSRMGDIESAKVTNGRVPRNNWREKKRIVRSIVESEAQSNHQYDALATMWSVECPQGNQHRVCLGEYESALADVTRVLAKNGDEKLAFAWVQSSSLPAAKAKCLLEIANGLLDRISPPVSFPEMNASSWDTY